jgi:hypothetical protein
MYANSIYIINIKINEKNSLYKLSIKTFNVAMCCEVISYVE